MSPRKEKYQKGFTLIELIVSITVFITVMTIAMGAIFSVFNSNAKSKNMKTALANLNVALESMSREIRFGSVYHCGPYTYPNILTPQDCPAGDSRFTFISSDGTTITYRQNSQAVDKNVNGGGPVRVTGPEITIQSLTFYTLGSSQADTLQPKTVIIVRGTVGTGSAKAVTSFAMQTLVSQRVIDR